ncbi:MAG: hypothetical protein U5L72_16905 [Bacteroidales bacterium]|nr:hypothetical protein [Bacteroidales bacterium]
MIPNSVIETSPGVFVENTNIPIQNGRQSYWTDTYNDVKENYVRDASAFKIRELAVSYTLPASIVKGTPIEEGGNWPYSKEPLHPPSGRKRILLNLNSTSNNNNSIGIGGYFHDASQDKVVWCELKHRILKQRIAYEKYYKNYAIVSLTVSRSVGFV